MRSLRIKGQFCRNVKSLSSITHPSYLICAVLDVADSALYMMPSVLSSVSNSWRPLYCDPRFFSMTRMIPTTMTMTTIPPSAPPTITAVSVNRKKILPTYTNPSYFFKFLSSIHPKKSFQRYFVINDRLGQIKPDLSSSH